MSRTSRATTQTVNSCIHYNRCRKYTALWVMSQQRRVRLCAMQNPILISCSAWYLRTDSSQAVLYYTALPGSSYTQLNIRTPFQNRMHQNQAIYMRLVPSTFAGEPASSTRQDKAHRINIKNRFHNSPPNSLYNIGDTQPLFAGSWGGCASTRCPAAPCHRAHRCTSLAQLRHLGPKTRYIA